MVYLAKWKIILILGISLLGIALAAPNILSRQTAERLPNWLPHQQIALGLDLQGGSHLLFEVNTKAVVAEELNALVEAVRNTLRKERIFYTGLGVKGEAVVFQLRNPADAERVSGLARELSSSVANSSAGLGSIVGGLTGSAPSLTVTTSPQGEVKLQYSEQALRDRQARAIDQSLEIIRRRIDETGVREPNIQREGEDRILVQLP